MMLAAPGAIGGLAALTEQPLDLRSPLALATIRT